MLVLIISLGYREMVVGGRGIAMCGVFACRSFTFRLALGLATDRFALSPAKFFLPFPRTFFLFNSLRVVTALAQTSGFSSELFSVGIVTYLCRDIF